jgi:hypothetical protein
MARARFIRPEFFTDEKVSDLPFGAALLFTGIWCHSDLRGVFEYSPRVLRGLIFPMRDGIETGTVAEWLQQLESLAMVGHFEAEGKQWGYVRNWFKYQQINGREREIGSRRPIPPTSGPDGDTLGTGQGHARAASPSPTPSPTPAPAEGEDTHTRADGLGEFLEDFKCKTERAGVSILDEWELAIKGLKPRRVRQILEEAKPGIQWPSEFRAARAARGI